MTALTAPHSLNTMAVVLAGGASTRAGGQDKAWLHRNGQTMVEHVLGRLLAQAPVPDKASTSPATPRPFRRLGVNTNRHFERYQTIQVPGLSIWSDEHSLSTGSADIPAGAGPLLGILSSMDWITAHAPEVEWLFICPCDTADLPAHTFATLAQAYELAGRQIVAADSKYGRQVLVALLHRSSADSLRQALLSGARKVQSWYAAQGSTWAKVDDSCPTAFANLNYRSDFDA